MVAIRMGKLFGVVALAIGLAAFSVSVAEAADETGDTNPSATTEGDPALLTTVGMALRIEQYVFPGAELMVRPLEDRHEPFVLRISQTFKHGTSHRYDFEFYALEPGTYNLADYLVLAGGGEAQLPPLPVEVRATLPLGQIVPAKPEPTQLRWLGGYRLWVGLGALLWLAGLGALLFAHRRKAPKTRVAEESSVSLADRLRPLVRAARDGSLAPGERAALERMLITYWSRKLNLLDRQPGELMAQLRGHEDAGPLITSLEHWLHHPSPTEPIDLDQLLAPYADVSDAEFAAAGPVDEAAVQNSGRRPRSTSPVEQQVPSR